jgi:FtsZ-binding cell division protein ZapB
MFTCGVRNRTGITSALFVVGNGTSSTRKNAFIVIGDPGSTAYAYLNGTSSSNGTAVTSDERIKTLIKNLTPSESKEFLQSITPRMYYKEESNPEGELGFYAQEVENTIYGKQLVTKDNSGVYDIPDFRIMSYEGFIAPIVSSLQGVFKEVDELKEHDKRLENEIDELKKENEELRDQNKKLEERLARLEQLLLND